MAGQGREADRLPFDLRAGEVKSYALEVNFGDGEDGALGAVESLAASLGLSMARTEDPALALLWNEAMGLFVDYLDPRFWLIHTAAPAGIVHGKLRSAVWSSRGIDWCWFPWQFLRELQGRGEPRWFKSEFRGDELLPSEGVRARRLRVQLEGDSADELLEQLIADDRYRLSTALSGVALRVRDRQLGVVDEAAHYQGRFVGRGGAFELHLGFMSRAVQAYAEAVRHIERHFALGWDGSEERGFGFEGHVLQIRFGRRIDDLSQFLTGLFSCRDPFRLWAVPRLVNDRFAEAEVVDLHVGQQFRMDISSEWLRVYLSSGVCGNTVVRLVTNLQRRYDASIVAGDSTIDLTSLADLRPN
jgi:hypothetical protein